MIGFGFIAFTVELVNKFRLDALGHQVGINLPARFPVNFSPEHIPLGRLVPVETASQAILKSKETFVGGLFLEVGPQGARPVVTL